MFQNFTARKKTGPGGQRISALGRLSAGILALVLGLGACGAERTQVQKPVEKGAKAKLDFILDWTPNTNHTGLFVAAELGYYAEEGLEVDIKQPPEDSTSDLIINNKAPFGIYFQDSMAAKLSKGAPLVAVAAIVEHNTSGIVSSSSAGVQEPRDLQGKRYGTWNDPVELGMLQSLMEGQKADFSQLQLVPNTDSNSLTSIANGLFDAAWIYQGWDGIMAQQEKIPVNFFYLRDFSQDLDFYSPVIISNESYLKENPEQARAFLRATKKGYIYAMEHPKEAADILLKHAPELAGKKDFVYASQAYLSKAYSEKAETWGEIDPERWNRFYRWLNSRQITAEPIADNQGFSNDYLPR